MVDNTKQPVGGFFLLHLLLWNLNFLLDHLTALVDSDRETVIIIIIIVVGRAPHHSGGVARSDDTIGQMCGAAVTGQRRWLWRQRQLSEVC